VRSSQEFYVELITVYLRELRVVSAKMSLHVLY
jgi:hypothetical protein